MSVSPDDPKLGTREFVCCAQAERHAIGKQMRHQVPCSALGLWSPSARTADPIDLIIELHRGRKPELIPLRVERMLASPYGFLRGSAIVMAADLATLPATGITPVICGDSHVGNFGFYASPERDLVIDLNAAVTGSVLIPGADQILDHEMTIADIVASWEARGLVHSDRARGTESIRMTGCDSPLGTSEGMSIGATSARSGRP